jgi:hypothetical protein
MHTFEHLDLKTLKKICSKYNIHVKIAKYSKLSKEELIPHMKKHLYITQEGKIKMCDTGIKNVDDELSKIIDELHAKLNAVKEKIKKPRAKKEAPKPKEAPKLKEVPKPKKEYNNYSDYNKEEEEFIIAIRTNNAIHHPEKIQKIYKQDFSNKNIEDFYIHRMNIAKKESLENLEKSINNNHIEHVLSINIDELNEKIKNNRNFKTKQAQKKADERIEQWEKEKYPKVKELEKNFKIKNIQEQNYEKLKDMKIESVKDADEYADLINASSYINLIRKLNAEEEKKKEEDKIFMEKLNEKNKEDNDSPIIDFTSAKEKKKIEKKKIEKKKIEKKAEPEDRNNIKEFHSLHKQVKEKLDKLKPYLKTVKLDTYGRRDMPENESDRLYHYYNIETPNSSTNGIEASVRALKHLDKMLNEFIVKK